MTPALTEVGCRELESQTSGPSFLLGNTKDPLAAVDFEIFFLGFLQKDSNLASLIVRSRDFGRFL